jgi:hypothetical protein
VNVSESNPVPALFAKYYPTKLNDCTGYPWRYWQFPRSVNNSLYPKSSQSITKQQLLNSLPIVHVHNYQFHNVPAILFERDRNGPGNEQISETKLNGIAGKMARSAKFWWKQNLIVGVLGSAGLGKLLKYIEIVHCSLLLVLSSCQSFK